MDIVEALQTPEPNSGPSCCLCGAQPNKAASDIGNRFEVFWTVESGSLQVTAVAMVLANDSRMLREQFFICPLCWPRLRLLIHQNFGVEPVVTIEKDPDSG